MEYIPGDIFHGHLVDNQPGTYFQFALLYWLTSKDAVKNRTEILYGRLGHVGDEEVFIEPPFRVDYGPNIFIGKRFYSNFNLTFLDSATVTVGDPVVLGPNVMISTATQETEVSSRRANLEFAKPVTIGDDCWIGGGAMMLAGVTIGDCYTIGAGSVFTKDIPGLCKGMRQEARCRPPRQFLPPPASTS